MNQGVYPWGNDISDAYIARARPIAERQLRLAGERLADLLNRALGVAPAVP